MTDSRLFVIVGGAYGDEGKGKMSSYLAVSRKDTLGAVARAGVGTNAGHTVVYNGETFPLRTIPSGFMIKDAKMYVGAGVLINEKILFDEIEKTNTKGRIFLDEQTGVIEQKHIDAETKNKHLMEEIGSTGSGCGAANAERAERTLKMARDFENLKPLTTDVSKELYEILENGKDVIVEGSQATFLSLFHGGYPHVTSKDVSASAALADVGLGPTFATDVVIVFKAFVTRVGEGPLKNELSLDEIKKRGWDEYGTVTGRPRRAAPFDFELAKRACRINGATSIALTKMDIVFPELEGKTEETDLQGEALEFVKKVEQETKVPVKYVSTGPGAKEVIELK